MKYIEKKYLKRYIHKMVNSRNDEINITGIVRKIDLNLSCMSLPLFIEFHSKRKVFGAFCKFSESITSIVLYIWIYLFTLTYFTRNLACVFSLLTLSNKETVAANRILLLFLDLRF